MKKVIGIVGLAYLIYYIFHILKDLFFVKQKYNEEEGERYSFESRDTAKKITVESLEDQIKGDNPTLEEVEQLFYNEETLENWDNIGQGVDMDYQKFAEEQRIEKIQQQALILSKPMIEKEIEIIANKTINSTTDTEKEIKKAEEISNSNFESFLKTFDSIDTSNEVSIIGSKLAELGI